MERKRGTIIGAVIALVIAVISLGVAFATFSTQLTINGTATVQSSKWDIFFMTASGGSKPTSSTPLPSANINESNTSGYPETVTSASGSIVATTLTWSASFKTPGDRVRFTVYVKNGGDYNAKISNISLPNVTCTKGGSAETTVCSHIHYGIYTNTGGTTALAENRALNAGDTDTYYVIAWLDDTGWETDGSDLPNANVTTATISATVTYQQTN